MFKNLIILKIQYLKLLYLMRPRNLFMNWDKVEPGLNNLPV